MVETGYRNPYKHWVSGLITEIVVFAAFGAVCVIVSLLVANLAG